MNRAMTSLPVPDSPCRHVVASVAATCVARLMTSRHACDVPMGASICRPASIDEIGRRWSFVQTHRGRPRRVMLTVKEIGCCMWSVHWPTSIVDPIRWLHRLRSSVAAMKPNEE